MVELMQMSFFDPEKDYWLLTMRNILEYWMSYIDTKMEGNPHEHEISHHIGFSSPDSP